MSIVPLMHRATGIAFEPLKQGLSREAILDFNSEWCRAYFVLSGDANHTLHGERGARIVQGTAILTRIGAVISEHMRGFMVASFGEVRFKKPVLIGNQVRIIMERLDRRNTSTRVRVTLQHMDGTFITETRILLIRN